MCCGVRAAVLTNRHPRRDADGFTPLKLDFTQKRAFPASLSLFDADLSNPFASRESSRFVCFARSRPCGEEQLEVLVA